MDGDEDSMKEISEETIKTTARSAARMAAPIFKGRRWTWKEAGVADAREGVPGVEDIVGLLTPLCREASQRDSGTVLSRGRFVVVRDEMAITVSLELTNSAMEEEIDREFTHCGECGEPHGTNADCEVCADYRSTAAAEHHAAEQEAGLQ